MKYHGMGCYIRDGRAPIPEKELVSRMMSSIGVKNTGPELAVRKGLCSAGLGGYRLHWKKAPGRPDICYPGKKAAIFIHGCYWHRCHHCKPSMPKTHLEFWETKFRRNIERDARKLRELRREGWRPLVIWECQVKEDLASCIERIERHLLKG
jgi:DNA mismatch endonuclease (patch repair protein)